ncbi:MAG TPA: rod shape-determining protein MreC [Silvibacterium sp.]|nr:rod shape-determining protein MreC [Silvibacterium sp.]
MESFFSRYKNALVLIVVLVAQLLALAVQAKRPTTDGGDRRSVSLMRFAVITIITPPERVLHSTGHWFRSVWFGYIDLIHVRRENSDLRGEIQRLRLEQATIAQDAEQGRRLQHMLGFSESYIYKTQPAQVIGTGGTDQSQVVLIDKGSASGLKSDMSVITADGIVGKVKEVSRYSSQVLLVSDPTSGVGVILENTRIRGVLKGRAYGQLQVADVSPDARIKVGEPIVTSGGDQIFPRGLAVGTVQRVIADPDRDPLVDVLVRPAAKLSQLEEVLVVTSMSDAASPQETKDLAESEAEGEAAQKRASDVLSERLPSRTDPNGPADTNPEDLVDAAGNAIKKTAPPKPNRPDGFSPNAEPDAAQMSPGQRFAPVKDGTEDSATPLRSQLPQKTVPASAVTAVSHARVPKPPATSSPAPHKSVAPPPVTAAPASQPPRITAPSSGDPGNTPQSVTPPGGAR